MDSNFATFRLPNNTECYVYNQSNETTVALAGDPESVVNVLDVGKFLYILFSNSPKPNDNIDKVITWLGILHSDMRDLHNDLLLIRQSIESLKLYFDEVRFKEAENSLLSHCDNVNQTLSNIVSNPQDWQQLFVQKFSEINTISNNIRRHKNYAAIYTIGYAYTVLINMILALKIDKQTRVSISRSNLEFFENCLSDPNGIEYLISVTENTIYQLESTWQAGDKGAWLLYYYNNNGNRWRFTVCYKVDGNLKDGFTLSVNSNDEGFADASKPGDWYNESRTVALGMAQERLNNEVAPSWNKQSNSYNNLLANKRILMDLREKCKYFITICKVNTGIVDEQ